MSTILHLLLTSSILGQLPSEEASVDLKSAIAQVREAISRSSQNTDFNAVGEYWSLDSLIRDEQRVKAAEYFRSLRSDAAQKDPVLLELFPDTWNVARQQPLERRRAIRIYTRQGERLQVIEDPVMGVMQIDCSPMTGGWSATFLRNATQSTIDVMPSTEPGSQFQGYCGTPPFEVEALPRLLSWIDARGSGVTVVSEQSEHVALTRIDFDFVDVEGMEDLPSGYPVEMLTMFGGRMQIDLVVHLSSNAGIDIRVAQFDRFGSLCSDFSLLSLGADALPWRSWCRQRYLPGPASSTTQITRYQFRPLPVGSIDQADPRASFVDVPVRDLRFVGGVYEYPFVNELASDAGDARSRVAAGLVESGGGK